MGNVVGGLRPSVVRLTIPDPAEQVPLVARSVTPPSPPTSHSERMERGDDTAPAERAPRSCTVFVMTPPMNTPVRVGETIEGSRTMRNRPYPVLKCSSVKITPYLLEFGNAGSYEHTRGWTLTWPAYTYVFRQKGKQRAPSTLRFRKFQGKT